MLRVEIAKPSMLAKLEEERQADLVKAAEEVAAIMHTGEGPPLEPGRGPATDDIAPLILVGPNSKVCGHHCMAGMITISLSSITVALAQHMHAKCGAAVRHEPHMLEDDEHPG